MTKAEMVEVKIDVLDTLADIAKKIDCAAGVRPTDNNFKCGTTWDIFEKALRARIKKLKDE